jgi:hypothetical protein
MIKLGWAFFALTVIVAAAYALDHGIFVGSQVRLNFAGFLDHPPSTYLKECRYLFITGIHSQPSQTGTTPEEADQGVCLLFQH